MTARPEDVPGTVKFGSRARGVLLGLGVSQMAALGAGILATLEMLQHSIAGFWLRLAPLAAGASLALFRRHGRPVAEWLPTAVAYAVRPKRFRRQAPLLPLSQIALPAELTAGTSTTPSVMPELRDVRIVGVKYAADEAGIVLDGDRWATATLLTQGSGWSLSGTEEKAKLNADWGQFMASGVVHDKGAVTRLQIRERTGPAVGGSLERHLEEHQCADPAPGALADYRALLDTAAPVAREHEALVTVRLDRRRVRDRIADAGGGDAGAARVLLEELPSVQRGLEDAGIAVVGVLSPKELIEDLAVSADPGWRLARAQLPADARRVDPMHAWPTAVLDGASAVRVNGAYHCVLFAEQLPRRWVRPDFMAPTILSTGLVARTISITIQPAGGQRSEDLAQRRSATQTAERMVRRRFKLRVGPKQQRQEEDALRREWAISDGAVDVVAQLLVSVTAPTPALLEQGVRQVIERASKSDIVLQRCQLDHARMWAMAALPLARMDRDSAAADV
jgi:Putative type VII ESX secretion system translocon, EccE